MKRRMSLAPLLVSSLFLTLPLTAEVLEVGPGGFPDIQSAIDAASNGDEILVSPGIYRDTDGDGIVARIGDGLEEKSLTLRASGAPGSAILEYAISATEPSTGQAIVVINGSDAPIDATVIDGLMIRADSGSSAPRELAATRAALECQDATVFIRNCFFDDNDGPNFISSHGPFAFLSFTSCDFHQNDSVLQMMGAQANFNDCKFWNSSSLIDIDSPYHTFFRQSSFITNCIFEDQSTCIQVSNFSSLVVRNCNFIRTIPLGVDRYAAVQLDGQSMAILTSCQFNSKAGAAVDSNNSLLYMNGVLIEATPGYETKGVVTAGFAPPLTLYDWHAWWVAQTGNSFSELPTSPTGSHVELYDVQFKNCNAEAGGALDIQSSGTAGPLYNVLVKNCEFSGNHTDGRGAAINVDQSEVDIKNCHFLGNSAASNGHAILTSGGALGYTRIMNNLFKDNGDPSTPSSAKTVLNDGMNTVQCFENRFCGDAGDALGGSAISAWDNLLAGACWADFPNPRGISEFIHMPIVTAHAMAVLATDQAIATGGTSHNAMTEATFDSFPILADAYTNGVLEASAPTENGLIYELHAMGQLYLQPGGNPNPLDVESRVGFTPRLEVSTTEEQVLDITIDARDASPEFSFWSHMSHTIAVQNADTGELLTPVIDDPAGSYWRYHLPADGSYLIDLDFECGKMLTASDFETVGSSINGYFDIEFEFQREGDGDGGEEEALAGDLDGNNIVNGADLGLMLSLFGGQDPKGDLDQNGSINGGDLGILLANWSN